ncbi:MAG: hypothetical protein Kow0068_01830 [Marinilabiliales bacterium]
MKLVVISYPKNFADETHFVIRLFQNGLKYFHLRKPGFSEWKIREFLIKIPQQYHNRIVIYDYFHLVKEFNLKGIHFNRKTIHLYKDYENLNCHKSYSAHYFDELIKYDGLFDYMFISPVFDSISKNNYHSSFNYDELKNTIKNQVKKSEIIALGGVSPDNVKTAISIGFHGIALHGNIWNTYFENNDFNPALNNFNIINGLSQSSARPVVLTIGGFDPSSGAGLTADIKTMEMLGAYGVSACTAITYQNDKEFFGIDWLCFGKIKQQLDVLLSRFNIEYVKIGIIENIEVLSKVVDYLIDYNNKIIIVWDPVIKSETGFLFHKELDYSSLKNILKKIYLVTPNYHEYQIIFNGIDDLNNIIRNDKICHVLLKGGHKQGKEKNDELFTKEGKIIIKGKDFKKIDKHGTGCVLSSAIISYLALEDDIQTACSKAKEYTEKFLQSNDYKLGYHYIMSYEKG